MSDTGYWSEDSPWIVYNTAFTITQGEFPFFAAREEIIEDYTKLEFVIRFNDVGTWQITLPVTGPSMRFIAQTNNANTFRSVEIAYRKADGSVVTVLDGPITSIERVHDATGDTIIVSGSDQNVWLRDTLCIPQGLSSAWQSGDPDVFHSYAAGTPQWPGHSQGNWLPQTGQYYDAFAGFLGFAGDVLHSLAMQNAQRGASPTGGAGTGTLFVVFIPPLVSPPGDHGDFRQRFTNVLEAMQDIATHTSNMPERWPLQFRMMGRRHTVVYPTDTGCRFAESLGTLSGWHTRYQCDSANWILVAGGGEMRYRMIAATNGYGRGNISTSGPPAQFWPSVEGVYPELRPPNAQLGTGPWRRVESFRDRRDSEDWNILVATGYEEARKGIERPTVSFTALDVPHQTFIEHYNLGDIAEVWLTPDQTIRSVISSVHVVLAAGEAPVIRPVVGFGEPAMLETFRALADMRAGLRDLSKAQ